MCGLPRSLNVSRVGMTYRDQAFTANLGSIAHSITRSAASIRCRRAIIAAGVHQAMSTEIEFSIQAPNADLIQPLLNEFETRYQVRVKLRLLTWDAAWSELV